MRLMHNMLRVAATLVSLAGCHGDLHDAGSGTIELVFEPIQRSSAPDPAGDLGRVRSLVARRLAGIPVPAEVEREGGRLLVRISGDTGPDLVSRAKAAVVTQGRLEFHELAGNALGPVLVDNGAIRDALSTFAGKVPAITVSLRRDAAERFEAATRRLVGSRILISLDDRLLAAPLVEAPISGGQIQIALGDHPPPTHALADTIVLVLKAGEPLPFPLRLLEERRILPRAGGS